MNRNLPILVAEDDPNDVTLLKRAFLKNGINNPVHVCSDGEDAIAYLQGSGSYRDREKFPFPSILITDIKMPRRNGFEILQWLREHPECHIIPVMVLSASREERDVKKSYEMGANAYIHKPSSFAELVKLMQIASEFWSVCEKPALPDFCAHPYPKAPDPKVSGD